MVGFSSTILLFVFCFFLLLLFCLFSFFCLILGYLSIHLYLYFHLLIYFYIISLHGGLVSHNSDRVWQGYWGRQAGHSWRCGCLWWWLCPNFPRSVPWSSSCPPLLEGQASHSLTVYSASLLFWHFPLRHSLLRELCLGVSFSEDSETEKTWWSVVWWAQMEAKTKASWLKATVT